MSLLRPQLQTPSVGLFNQSLEQVDLPAGLQELNLSVEEAFLPAGLQSLAASLPNQNTEDSRAESAETSSSPECTPRAPRAVNADGRRSWRPSALLSTVIQQQQR